MKQCSALAHPASNTATNQSVNGRKAKEIANFHLLQQCYATTYLRSTRRKDKGTSKGGKNETEPLNLHPLLSP